ncbi:MAG: hypothetical protein PHV25_02420 [Candidatus Pacebacteria bacterium]|nr:hypothetical protein [Candidatus Paceibacterota bacterium]
MIATNLAIKYSHKLFTAPEPTSVGTNNLINSGLAAPILSVEELVDFA